MTIKFTTVAFILMLLIRASSLRVPALRPARLTSFRALSNEETPGITNKDRVDLLHNFLTTRHKLDPEKLKESNCDDVGESALKAYRTYISPSSKKLEAFLTHPPHMLTQAAERTSNQISHLVDRHRASRSDVLRNSDDSSAAMNISKNPLVVVLVDVRSSSNVGQLLRTADAVAAEKIVCVGITPTPGGLGGNKVKKVSLGSEVREKVWRGTWRTYSFVWF